MSDKDFTDITDEVGGLVADPYLGPAIQTRRKEMREADRVHAMGLAAIRNAFDLTQAELAKELGVSQANVAKIEKRHDFLVSTLRSYFRAIGGEVRVLVAFQDHEVEVSLESLDDTTEESGNVASISGRARR